MFKKLLATSITLFIITTTGVAAWAHAELMNSNPEDGSVVQVMPNAFSLTFGEELLAIGDASVNTLKLVDPTGTEIALTPEKIDGDVLSATIENGTAQLPQGTYTLSYRVVSADGHPVKGTISFEVSPQNQVTTTQQSPAAASDPKSTSVNLGVIAPFLIIIVILSALLLIRKRR